MTQEHAGCPETTSARPPSSSGKQLLISDNCWKGVSSVDPGLQTPWCFSYREGRGGRGEAAERDFKLK